MIDFDQPIKNIFLIINLKEIQKIWKKNNSQFRLLIKNIWDFLIKKHETNYLTFYNKTLRIGVG